MRATAASALEAARASRHPRGGQRASNQRHEATTGVCLFALLALGLTPSALANWVPARGAVDARMRVAPYSPDQVYRLYGYVGYQIDIEFARGEVFKGLAAGDIRGISFEAHGRDLFIKPRVAHVHTNLTVLTNLRQYEFDYSASLRPPDPALGEVIYALRFTYPGTRATQEAALNAKRITRDLAKAPSLRHRNYDYWYCGVPQLKPEAAWDDGVRTWIRFGAREPLPAIFVQSADGTESLVNFSMEGADVVIQRVAHRFVLRRGRLTGCIVNRDFTGGGKRLASHTVSPLIERVTKRPAVNPGAGP